MITRLHRLRTKASLRDLVVETRLNKHDFIMPIFIHEGLETRKEIASLPGVYQETLESLLTEVEQISEAGIKAVILFGLPTKKDELGSESYNPDGIIQKAIRAIKQAYPSLMVIADCCLCEYTDHGHCGVIRNDHIQNDQTLELLQKIAVTYAESGADVVAPSGRMDGMVAAIREGLDRQGFSQVSIMSYSIKFASHFYGPFREAAGSSNFKVDRKQHQLSFTQRRESLREAEIDEKEGADFLMVKPALTYLDILSELRQSTHLPLVAYNVSGEYAMLKQAAQAGIIEERAAFEEVFTGFKRAGADLIISYYAKIFCQSL